MLKKLSIHNYKCLVTFELELSNFHIFCGANGSGKSSVIDALQFIKDFASGSRTLEHPEYRHLQFCTWLNSDLQKFELEFFREGKTYRYLLHLQQTNRRVLPRVVMEKAVCEDRILFERELENVHFPKPDGSSSGFPLDWRQAALGAIQATPSRVDIINLQKAIDDLIIIRPNPLTIAPDSNYSAKKPDFTLQNLISWFRELSDAQEYTDVLREKLRTIWPDFHSLKLETVGIDTKALLLKFQAKSEGQNLNLWFHQLSDGERMLFALYALCVALDLSISGQIFIDEPDNYVSLTELQPWLIAMLETINNQKQIVVVSHNPEILNMTGEDTALYFERENHISPTRVRALKIPNELTPAETVARGWINAS